MIEYDGQDESKITFAGSEIGADAGDAEAMVVGEDMPEVLEKEGLKIVEELSNNLSTGIRYSGDYYLTEEIKLIAPLFTNLTPNYWLTPKRKQQQPAMATS